MQIRHFWICLRFRDQPARQYLTFPPCRVPCGSSSFGEAARPAVHQKWPSARYSRQKAQRHERMFTLRPTWPNSEIEGVCA